LQDVQIVIAELMAPAYTPTPKEGNLETDEVEEPLSVLNAGRFVVIGGVGLKVLLQKRLKLKA
jgi:hypothetical protein